MTRAALLALLVLVAACDEETSDPRTLLNEPRILGVRAEPPVLGPNGVATLEALVVDAGGGAVAAEVAWRACDPWRFVLDPDADCGPDAALPLTDARLDVPALLRRFPPPDGQLPGGTPPPPSGDDCAEPLELELPIVAETRVGDRRLVSIKRIALMLPPPSRTNPVLGAPHFDGEPAPGAVAAGREVELDIAPRFDSLDTVCFAGERRPEPVSIYLYATAGDLADSSIDAAYDANGSLSAEVTTWTAPESGAALLWFVAVDVDGGVDWTSLRVETR